MSIPQHFRAKFDRFVQRWPGFQKTSQEAARTIHQGVIEGGETVREAVDVLHGKPVGHPLHPILTDITIGSWLLGALFDLLSLVTLSRSTRKAANRLVTLGTITAVPTALAGIADYSTVKQSAAGHAALHGIVNTIAFMFYFRSVRARFENHVIRSVLYSFAGLSFAALAAWLGGDLVYRHRMGVNHAEDQPLEDWTPALSAGLLAEGERRRVDVKGQPVLLYRYDGQTYAIGAVCSHLGGPLEQGKIVDEVCIQCPWHDSVFDLRDGHVVHGPATFEEPFYETRIFNGQIEIRRWSMETAAEDERLTVEPRRENGGSRTETAVEPEVDTNLQM
jgi:nitrite reductase/ring-hydroxylating ferredoxin subunit/uncharacterized membrane protein